MTERGIAFSSAKIRLVDAMLARGEREFQTRRVIGDRWMKPEDRFIKPLNETIKLALIHECPYGPVGRILYQKEGYRVESGEWQTGLKGRYLVDDAPFHKEVTWGEWQKWTARKHPCRPTPSRFMYHSLARRRFEVVDIRAERLQEITEDDAEAEGVEWDEDHGDGWREYGEGAWPGVAACVFARDSFAMLWDQINARRGHSWESDPWVWALTLKVL